MRIYMYCIFMLFGVGSVAQSYKELEDKAYALAETNDNKIENATKAYRLFTQLHNAYPEKDDFWNLYYTALAANTIGYSKACKQWLLKAIEFYKQVDISVIQEYAAEDFSLLFRGEDWKILNSRIDSIKSKYKEHIIHQTDSLSRLGLKKLRFDANNSGKECYDKISGFSDFPELATTFLPGYITVNDTLMNTYFARLPKGYNPHTPSKVLFFLNGAVRFQNIPFYATPDLEEGWQRFYKDHADKNNIIMVYPNCNKVYNWMLDDQGFFMIPAILKQLKSFVNIDDDGVFISGHSNGATGSFNYLVKNPTPFAGFYGFNTQPKVYTGGTFMQNCGMRYFYNVSTDQDYYFHPDANDSLVKLTDSMGIPYLDHRYKGFPHWFPEFDASEVPVKNIFKSIVNTERNSFRNKLFWVCDDIVNGRADWIAINSLDTLKPKKNWHRELNITIHKKLYYDKNDSLQEKKVNENAFEFPRKSGAVSAEFHDNIFTIETSCVDGFSVFISPEMVAMDKPVLIYVNGKLMIQQQPVYDKQYMLQSFYKNFDRKNIWVQEIVIRLY